MSRERSDNSRWNDVWVFAEIQDHERVLDGALELLTRGREIADRLGERLVALLFGLEAEQYLPVVKRYGPDLILCCSDPRLKHYDSQIFPDFYEGLIHDRRPSIILFPSTEAGTDLAPRLARRFSTGVTSHCTDLGVLDSTEHGSGLLMMKRPSYGGNAIATVICPHARPQMATVQQGVFEKRESSGIRTEIEQLDFGYDMTSLRITATKAPLRWDRPRVPLEQAIVVIAGGRGLGTKKHFDRLHELSDLLGGEVGATRVPVFNGWCGEERMVGQTGKTIHPKFYLGFGISGQIQHTTAIIDAAIIASVNLDHSAPITEISDYVITEDAGEFLARLIERLRRETRP